jgi:hypothetical protein
MKRAISLLLAMVVAFGLSAAAFAATDVPGRLTPSPRIELVPGAAAADNQYKIKAGEIFLANKDGQIVGFETRLIPGKTYEYDIYHATADTGGKASDIFAATSSITPLTKADIGEKGQVQFHSVKGARQTIQSTKVKTKGNGPSATHYVEIKTREAYGTKTSDVEYELSVNGVGAPTYAPAKISFKVGFPAMDDSLLDVGEEGTIIIENEAPVIMKDQFTEIAKSANYKNIYIESEEDGNWSFKGKVAGMKDTNFYYDFDPDTDLLNKFPEQEFKFLSFRGGVNFPTNGEMRIDVSDVSDVFDTLYPYLYRDGKLTSINGTYDASTSQLVFRTNHLGKFIITNKKITDSSMLPEEPVEEAPIAEVPAPPATSNPYTGVPIDLTAVFGLVSVAAGSLVSRKRTRK